MTRKNKGNSALARRSSKCWRRGWPSGFLTRSVNTTTTSWRGRVRLVQTRTRWTWRRTTTHQHHLAKTCSGSAANSQTTSGPCFQVWWGKGCRNVTERQVWMYLIWKILPKNGDVLRFWCLGPKTGTDLHLDPPFANSWNTVLRGTFH